MKTSRQLSQDRFLINYGDGRTVYKDPGHQVLQTQQPDGSVTELVMAKQPNGSYLPQFLSIRNPKGRVRVLQNLLTV